MERDLSTGTGQDQMPAGADLGTEVMVDSEVEARINAGYQRLVERVVRSGVNYHEYFPEGFSFSPDPEQIARVRADLATAFGTLSPRESRVLTLRNGLEGDPPKKLTEIGLTMDRPITDERVRQIEVKAMRKLRHPSRGIGVILAEILGKERVV